MFLRRRVLNVMLALISVVHVGACRLRFLRARAAPSAPLATGPILVVRCEAKLGDNLLNVPFLRAVRASFPSREIHLLHHRAARAVYAGCPYVDRRIEIDWPMSSPKTLWRRLSLCAAVFESSHGRVAYKLALLPRWDEDLYAPFLGWISGAARIVGFSRRVLPEKACRNLGTDALLTDAVLDRSVEHEARRPMALLTRFTGPSPAGWSSQLEFRFSTQDDLDVAKLMAADGPAAVQWIAVAPGAGLDRRKWPLARFRELVQALARRAHCRVLLLGSGSDAPDCSVLAAAGAPAALNLADRVSLSQTAAALSRCDLFVGNDSGLMHLACAVGTPVVEVSCHPEGAPDSHANAPARFGPFVRRSTVLRPAKALDRECRAGCVFDTAHCITTVACAEVLRAVETMLDARSTEGTPAGDPHGEVCHTARR